jgi:hypothetical protein
MNDYDEILHAPIRAMEDEPQDNPQEPQYEI